MLNFNMRQNRIVSPLKASLCPESIKIHSIRSEDKENKPVRRTKASLIYRRTKNLRAVQLLLGHRKLESTVRYLGIEVDDALEIAETDGNLSILSCF